jgi:flagellar motor switch protein FliN/FliY
MEYSQTLSVDTDMSDSKSPINQSLMQIETPVTVTLAQKRESLQRILSLVPGSIITFQTRCDEPLSLEAGGHQIAIGETVKVGDKFGLQIREIV